METNTGPSHSNLCTPDHPYAHGNSSSPDEVSENSLDEVIALARLPQTGAMTRSACYSSRVEYGEEGTKLERLGNKLTMTTE